MKKLCLSLCIIGFIFIGCGDSLEKDERAVEKELSKTLTNMAPTRFDAEIKSADTNVRTLLSDMTALYKAKGKFTNDDGSAVKYSTFTNVPLSWQNKRVSEREANLPVSISVGGKDCINIRIVEQADYAVAVFSQADNSSSICNAVKDSLKDLTHNSLKEVSINLEPQDTGAVIIGKKYKK